MKIMNTILTMVINIVETIVAIVFLICTLPILFILILGTIIFSIPLLLISLLMGFFDN